MRQYLLGVRQGQHHTNQIRHTRHTRERNSRGREDWGGRTRSRTIPLVQGPARESSPRAQSSSPEGLSCTHGPRTGHCARADVVAPHIPHEGEGAAAYHGCAATHRPGCHAMDPSPRCQAPPVRGPVGIAVARGPQTRRLGASAHHTDALCNATVASAGIPGNSSTTVNAAPGQPPPPLADEIWYISSILAEMAL